jgi:predicted negative regulator of RcsB-dependent stress response
MDEKKSFWYWFFIVGVVLVALVLAWKYFQEEKMDVDKMMARVRRFKAQKSMIKDAENEQTNVSDN